MRDWQPILGLPLWFWLFILPTLFALFCLFNPTKAKRLMSPIWPYWIKSIWGLVFCLQFL